MEELHFEPLNQSHFALIHAWFNKPHVQAFYSLRSWTLEEVQKKLTPYLQGEKPMSCFVIFHAQRPIGYIQRYPVKDHPWDNQALPEEIVRESAGIDLFIGEEDCLGKGLGSEIIQRFLENYIWPEFRYCLADPDIRNQTSIRLFEKCGFEQHKQIASKNALQRKVSLQLFIKERDLCIRKLNTSDLEVIAKTFCFPWTTEQQTFEKWKKYRSEQEQQKRAVYLLEKQGQIVGYASLLFFSEYANFLKFNIPEIHDVWIHEDFRKQGFGTRLIQHLENMAKKLGYKQIGLGVGLYADYGPAQILYCKLGYVPDGNGITYKASSVVPGKQCPVDDDLILWLSKRIKC